MAKCPVWAQSLILGLVFVPLTVGVIVKAFGWTIVLRSNGIVNVVLLNLGLIDSPLRLLFTPTALIAGMSNVYLPYMLLSIFSVVRMIDRRYLDAAACLGAGPIYRFFHVLVPLSLPGVIAGVSLVFSLSIAAYVAPLLLVGDRFGTMSVTIARSFLYVGKPATGATMAVILLVITATIVMLSSRIARGQPRS
jgi:putative spermidine/putrescine transport system permease protein